MESSRGTAPPASSDASSSGGVVLVDGKGARIFPCLFCNKTFLKSQALGGHQNAHKKERAVGSLNPYASAYAAGIELEVRAAGGSTLAATTSSTLVAGSPHCGGAVVAGGACRSREVPHWAVAAVALRSETERWCGQHAPAHQERGDSVIDVNVLNRSRGTTLAPADASDSTTEEPDLELRL